MIEAMKQWLDALDISVALNVKSNHHEKIVEAYESLRQAIAELESQEPLAWQVEVYIDGGWSPMGNPQRNKSRAEALASNPSIPKEKQRIVELYTHPPQHTWVDLTDDDIEHAYETTGHYQKLRPQDKFAVYALARAIAAKLKEKNNV